MKLDTYYLQSGRILCDKKYSVKLTRDLKAYGFSVEIVPLDPEPCNSFAIDFEIK
jgi:hypothetical protein